MRCGEADEGGGEGEGRGTIYTFVSDPFSRSIFPSLPLAFSRIFSLNLRHFS